MKRSNAVTVVLLGIMALGAGLTLWVFSRSGVIPSPSGIREVNQNLGRLSPTSRWQRWMGTGQSAA